jgi:hypothetical protein
MIDRIQTLHKISNHKLLSIAMPANVKNIIIIIETNKQTSYIHQIQTFRKQVPDSDKTEPWLLKFAWKFLRKSELPALIL